MVFFHVETIPFEHITSLCVHILVHVHNNAHNTTHPYRQPALIPCGRQCRTTCHSNSAASIFYIPTILFATSKQGIITRLLYCVCLCYLYLRIHNAHKHTPKIIIEREKHFSFQYFICFIFILWQIYSFIVFCR